MSNHDNKNFADTIIDSQKEAMDTVVENAKKLAGGNNMLNETIEKGTEWYKNWLDSQKTFFKKTTEKSTATAETVKETASKLNEFNENWFNTQSNWAKQMWEMNQDWLKNLSNGTANTTSNPFSAWQNNMANMNNMGNMTNQWNNWMNQMNPNNFMNQMQQNNPFSADGMKKANENVTGFFNQYHNIMHNNFADWQKNFQNGTTQDAYKNMMNSTEGFIKFAEMWTPMFKSIQDKTFNMDAYKQYMNPELHKEMMDKFFGFMPENSRNYMQQMSSFMQDSMKQMNGMGTQNFQQMRQMMGNTGFNPSEMFGNMTGGLSNWQNMMSQAAAPFTKMMTPTQQSKTMQEWTDIANRTMVYNIKNAELQYMVYNQGTKVMDKLAESVTKLIQEGKEVKSVLALYQDWLNISDKVFVSLFESDEYSKLMAEVSAMQMTLRKDIELQMEKSLKDIPVATRSEMDEVYKTIHELKGHIRQLEKMMDLDGEEEDTTSAEGKTATKRTKKA